MQQFVISNDNDAWLALSALLTDVQNASEHLDIKLDGWPVFDVKSKRGHGEIDTSTMKSFIAFQEGIYRTFLTYQNETRDLRTLSEEERRNLEISVRITEGSSIFKVELGEQFDKLAKALSDKMTGPQLAAILIAGGLLFAGHSVWKTHISENAKIRLAQIENKEDQERLRAFVELSEQETERMALLSEVFKTYPQSEQAELEADKARQDFLRNLPKDAEIDIEGITLLPEVLSEITKPERAQTRETSITRLFRVERAQTTRNGFAVRLSAIDSEQSFTATFGDIFKSSDQRKMVQEAFWQKSIIELTINAKSKDGVIISAEITDAKTPEEKT